MFAAKRQLKNNHSRIELDQSASVGTRSIVKCLHGNMTAASTDAQTLLTAIKLQLLPCVAVMFLQLLGLLMPHIYLETAFGQ